MDLFVVGIGGFFGAVARYLVYLLERSIGPHAFPLGTLAINLVGCLFAGLLLALVERSVPIHRHLLLLGSMGLVGSFTTFSTFSVESLQLMRSDQTLLAVINVGANTTFGILAVWLGRRFVLGLQW